jgi:hypothetical protein
MSLCDQKPLLGIGECEDGDESVAGSVLMPQLDLCNHKSMNMMDLQSKPRLMNIKNEGDEFFVTLQTFRKYSVG